MTTSNDDQRPASGNGGSDRPDDAISLWLGVGGIASGVATGSMFPTTQSSWAEAFFVFAVFAVVIAVIRSRKSLPPRLIWLMGLAAACSVLLIWSLLAAIPNSVSPAALEDLKEDRATSPTTSSKGGPTPTTASATSPTPQTVTQSASVPTPESAKPTTAVSLSSLAVIEGDDTTEVGDSVRVNKKLRGPTLEGKTYEGCYFSVQYQLDGAYQSFHALLGVSDGASDGTNVQFFIETYEKKKATYTASLLKEPTEIVFDLRGAERFTIYTERYFCSGALIDPYVTPVG